MAKQKTKKGKRKLKPTTRIKKEDKLVGSAKRCKDGHGNSVESFIFKIFWSILYNIWCKLGRTIAASLEALLRMARARNEGDYVKLPLEELTSMEQLPVEQKPGTGKAEDIEWTAEAMNASESGCEISPSAQNTSMTARHRTRSEAKHAVSERIDFPPNEVHSEALWAVVGARRASNSSNKSDTSKSSARSSTEPTVTCNSQYPSEAGNLNLRARSGVLNVSAVVNDFNPLSRRVAVPRRKSIVWTEEFIPWVSATDRNWPLVGDHSSSVKHFRGQGFAILPKGSASVSSGLEHLKAQTEKTDEERDRRDDWPPATVSPVLVDFGTSTWAYVVAGKNSIAKAYTTTAMEGDVSIGLKQSETQDEEAHSDANEGEVWTEEPGKQSAEMKPLHMRQDSAVVFEDADASQQSDLSSSVRDSGLRVEETDGREQLNVSPALNEPCPQIEATDNEEPLIVSTAAKDFGTQIEKADIVSNGSETHAETSANHIQAGSAIVSPLRKHFDEEQELVALSSQESAVAEESKVERKAEKRSTLRNRKKKEARKARTTAVRAQEKADASVLVAESLLAPDNVSPLLKDSILQAEETESKESIIVSEDLNDSAYPTSDLEPGNPKASVGIPTCDPTTDSPNVSPTATDSRAQVGKCIERALNFDFENEDDSFDDLMDDFKAKGWKPFNDEEYQRSTRKALSQERSVESIV
jgi:hypothetical protein